MQLNSWAELKWKKTPSSSFWVRFNSQITTSRYIRGPGSQEVGLHNDLSPEILLQLDHQQLLFLLGGNVGKTIKVSFSHQETMKNRNDV